MLEDLKKELEKLTKEDKNLLRRLEGELKNKNIVLYATLKNRETFYSKVVEKVESLRKLLEEDIKEIDKDIEQVKKDHLSVVEKIISAILKQFNFLENQARRGAPLDINGIYSEVDKLKKKLPDLEKKNREISQKLNTVVNNFEKIKKELKLVDEVLNYVYRIEEELEELRGA